jgi:hypothetical protein
MFPMNPNKSDIPLINIESSPAPRRAKRADAVANRELILATAQRLFAERGIANVCMAAIAEVAGVGKGTLYRGFMEHQAPLLREAQLHGILQSAAAASNASPQMWLPWLRQTVGVLLQQAQQNEEAENLDVPYLVDAILAPLSADLFLYQRETLGFELERISQGWRQMVLEGCKKRSTFNI